ncbi:myeloid differentiation primary response protein MyD88-like [Pecten maximus]|uniref:myeloid differentiation primary response protein MyD88-like n=1 Tax=Pecten maximus TaxID=6579 RepID=UPI001458AD76|nr:myeloid differentiation primary response protein MyD88-like [Pecten maximus]XP_033732522.1 myeloid differentiation primary response protein MyD88-like [Pecten maximus]
MAETEEIKTLIETMKDVHINSLNNGCRRKIGMFMDTEGSLIPDSDMFNDWCGLAELLNFTQPEIEDMKRQKSPTQEMLHLWSIRNDPEPKVGNFISFLFQLERFDVIHECRKMIERDVEKWRKNESSLRSIYDDPTFRDPKASARPPRIEDTETVKDVGSDHEFYYDCFVIYNPEAKDQLEFVKEMSRILEGPEYNFRLFVPWRDDLVGTAMYSVSAAIIEKKCRRCAVVLSNSFYNSPSADFQLKFAHALSPGARQKRVIPIVIEKMEVPSILNFVAPAPFYNAGIRHWQWPRVAATIQSELMPDRETWLPEVDAWNIALDTSDVTKRELWGVTLAVQVYPEVEEKGTPDVVDQRKKHKDKKSRR